MIRFRDNCDASKASVKQGKIAMTRSMKAVIRTEITVIGAVI